jgi:UDP-glucose 4-epimerase
MKDKIVVTGGAGFIGSNLIKKLLQETNYKIISIDNYSTGHKKNQITNKRIKYINTDTKNIAKVLFRERKKINSLFHFGEFSRIYQSFKNLCECIESNSKSSFEVFNFCLKNRIKLIYSATSASLGNKGDDRNLSPYAFTKSNNLELLENFKKWFNFKFEIIYFYNVYGNGQISKGKMATVIGIFEESYKKNNFIPVVKPGTQTRRFTHINDTINVCIEAWKNNLCKHYSISHKESLSIIEVAKLFGKKIKYLPERKGERFRSSLSNENLSNKVLKRFGSISLKDYVQKFKIDQSNRKYVKK